MVNAKQLVIKRINMLMKMEFAKTVLIHVQLVLKALTTVQTALII
jgi:hypothetical protein